MVLACPWVYNCTETLTPQSDSVLLKLIVTYTWPKNIGVSVDLTTWQGDSIWVVIGLSLLIMHTVHTEFTVTVTVFSLCDHGVICTLSTTVFNPNPTSIILHHKSTVHLDFPDERWHCDWIPFRSTCVFPRTPLLLDVKSIHFQTLSLLFHNFRQTDLEFWWWQKSHRRVVVSFQTRLGPREPLKYNIQNQYIDMFSRGQLIYEETTTWRRVEPCYVIDQ